MPKTATADRTITVSDVDGTAVTLAIGSMLFYPRRFSATEDWRASWAKIERRVITAISPQGDKIAYTSNAGRPEYWHLNTFCVPWYVGDNTVTDADRYSGPRFAVTEAQAQRVLGAMVRESVEIAERNLLNAQNLLAAVEAAVDLAGDGIVPELPEIVVEAAKALVNA